MKQEGTPRRAVAAVVGTFDGVHTGHRFLLDSLREAAAPRGLATRVYTFTTHPLATLRPSACPPQLTEPSEKAALLKDSGVDEVAMIDFADVASLTARQFIEQIAREGVELLMVGHDNRFGSDGLRTLDEFAEAARGTGVAVVQAPELRTASGEAINSTTTRRLIQSRDIVAANLLLGHPYTLTGIVVKGKQLGRQIGFPTANIVPLEPMKLVPPHGVWACQATLEDGTKHPAMVNIGTRPTVDGEDSHVTIEAHLIGWSGNLYGRLVTLEFLAYMRDERRFDSLGELVNQLERDREAVAGCYSSLCNTAE